ncbi:albusnodin/ikarugamycin family macrolactam cyclase [Embleya sp. AB8]|uniref:albusnodin/ikarugamycin family macrolactam cyclase n=1 Tax=Embleya sp. AB8 TaxID=3156304 RepID=UPI003C721FBD
MRWFAGTSESRSVARPTGARTLWDGSDPLWLVGNWPADEVRVVSRGGLRMAVLGICGATDAELEVGLAVARGGALRHLSGWAGSYHVVLRNGRRTVVLGDLAGVRQVFHAAPEDGVVYASHALPLADLTRAGLDTEALAARLACPDVPELVSGRSMFTGVKRLEPGHALELTHGVARVRLYEQHRSPLDFPGAADALGRALTDAVGRRVAGSDRPGADLSGGRDSAVLALLGARSVSQGKSRDLIAVTWAEPCAPDDPRSAADIVAGSARLRHLVIPGGVEHLPYTGLEEVLDGSVMPDEPGFSLIGMARITKTLAAIRDAGIDMHVTGYGGDAVLGTPLAYLADLAMDHRRMTIARHARTWARNLGMSAYDLAGSAKRVARTTFPQALDQLAEVFAGSGRADAGPAAAMAWCTAAPTAAWTTPEMRRRLAVSLRRLAGESVISAGSVVAADPAVHGRPGDRAAWVAVRRAAERQRAYQQLAERTGVRVQAPYLDTAVVRAGMALPAWARDRDDGPRALLTAAMHGLIPRQVLVEAHRADYTEAERRGLRINARVLRDLFADPLLAELGVLDPNEMRHTLNHAIGGANLSKNEPETRPDVPLGALADIVSAELWLRGVWEGRVMRWDATPSSAAGVRLAEAVA